MKLRPPFLAIVEELAQSREVSLDRLGDALGATAVSSEEIDAIMTALEARGVRVTSPSGGDGEDRLGRVIATARSFGRPATVAEIASASGLTNDEVTTALALVRVMQR